MRRLEEWCARQLNPILVQETRYILSRRATLVGYLLLLFFLAIFSNTMSRQAGAELSESLLGAFSLVGVTIIPAHVLFSSAARWSRQKREMVQLTALRPVDILLGRVLSSLSLVVLFLSVMMPFLSLTYLVRGADIFLMTMSIVMLLFLSVFTIIFSISIAWIFEQHSFQLVVKIIWMGILLLMSSMARGFPDFLYDIEKEEAFSPEIIVLWFCLGTLGASCFAFARSIVFLRHPEENRTTPMRVAIFLWLLFVLLSLMIFRVNSTTDVEGVFLGFVMAGFTIACTKFLLESDRIGRRALIDLPRAGWRRLVLLPILPGAGTGILMMGVLLLGFSLFCEIIHMLKPSRGGATGYGGYLYMASWWFSVSAFLLPLFRNVFDTVRQKTSIILSYYILVFLAIITTSGAGIDEVIDPFLNPFVGGAMIQERDPKRGLLLAFAVLLVVVVLLLQRRLLYRNISLIMRAAKH